MSFDELLGIKRYSDWLKLNYWGWGGFERLHHRFPPPDLRFPLWTRHSLRPSFSSHQRRVGIENLSHQLHFLLKTPHEGGDQVHEFAINLGGGETLFDSDWSHLQTGSDWVPVQDSFYALGWRFLCQERLPSFQVHDLVFRAELTFLGQWKIAHWIG